MILDDFKDFLSDHGVPFKLSGRSLVLKECPACGSNEWKVHLALPRDDSEQVMLGRCFSGKCQEGYSSSKYLILYGFSRSEVMGLHGLSSEKALEGLIPEIQIEKKEDIRSTKSVDIVDISTFIKVEDWPDHPASLYAIKRGYKGNAGVLIDPDASAVVFVCYSQTGLPIGYQKRFINASRPQDKTRTSTGFEKSENIITFPNKGNIVICEGPFTALAAWHYGYYGVCTFGSGVSKRQMELVSSLSDRSGSEIGVAFDNDEAGASGFDKVRSHMFWLGKRVFRVVGSTGNDLNDCWQANGHISEIRDEWLGPAIPGVPAFI